MSNFSKRICFACAALALAAGVSANSQTLHLTPDEQVELDLTVYSDFALVRDVRETTLPEGEVALEYEGVARTVEPASVRVRSLDGGPLEVIQQSYQYDLLDKQSLLERYIGRELQYAQPRAGDDEHERVLRDGVLLSTDPEIVQFGDEIEISPKGVISLPYIPEGLTTTPTLVWKLESGGAGKQQIETTYTAGDIGWTADYTLVLDENEKTLDLDSWINLTNESGKVYEQAGLKLVAGDVKRVSDGNDQPQMLMARAESADTSRGPQRSNLGDYHLYEYPGVVSLADKETVQLEFRSARDVPVDKQYVSVASVPMHQMREPQSNRFDIRLGFANSRQGPLGEPLPAGRVRVMKAGTDGHLQFLGEDRIGHSSVDARVDLTIGKAFDLGIERTQTDWRRLSERMSEITVEVAVSNSKTEPAHLIVQEKLHGDWEVISQTASGDKVDSTTLEFAFDLAAGESRTFTYTVRVTR